MPGKKKSVLRKVIGGAARGVEKAVGLRTKIQNKKKSIIKKGIKKLTSL